MDPFFVPYDATEVAIPAVSGHVCLLLEFPTGSEEVDMELSFFEDTKHILSRSKSRPYSGSFIPTNELNCRLNNVLSMSYAPGTWLNLGCDREPRWDGEEGALHSETGGQVTDGDEVCQREVPVDGRGREDTTADAADAIEIQRARSLAEDLRRLIRPDAHITGRKRKFSVFSAGLKLRKTLDQTEFKCPAAREIRDHTREGLAWHEICTSGIIHECRDGMLLLSEPSHNAPRGFLPFANVFGARSDDLPMLFDQQVRLAKGEERAIQRTRFEMTILADNARLIQCYKGRHKPSKRKVARSSLLNSILNDLYLSRGAYAWVFFASLSAKGSLCSDIGKLSIEDGRKFKADTLRALMSYKFEDVPDETPVFLYAALLGYLEGMTYANTCQALGLAHMANEDPGIASKLEVFRSNNPSDDEGRYRLDQGVRQVLTFTLGQLRESHLKLGNPDCRCADHQSVDPGHRLSQNDLSPISTQNSGQTNASTSRSSPDGEGDNPNALGRDGGLPIEDNFVPSHGTGALPPINELLRQPVEGVGGSEQPHLERWGGDTLAVGMETLNKPTNIVASVAVHQDSIPQSDVAQSTLVGQDQDAASPTIETFRPPPPIDRVQSNAFLDDTNPAGHEENTLRRTESHESESDSCSSGEPIHTDSDTLGRGASVLPIGHLTLQSAGGAAPRLLEMAGSRSAPKHSSSWAGRPLNPGLSTYARADPLTSQSAGEDTEFFEQELSWYDDLTKDDEAAERFIFADPDIV